MPENNLEKYLKQNISRPHPQDVYWDARREYAFMLRCEGLTVRDIGDRLGVTPGRARDLVYMQGSRVAKAIRRSRVQFKFLEG